MLSEANKLALRTLMIALDAVPLRVVEAACRQGASGSSDLPHRSLVSDLANYVSPRSAARNAVDDIERELLDRFADDTLHDTTAPTRAS